MSGLHDRPSYRRSASCYDSIHSRLEAADELAGPRTRASVVANAVRGAGFYDILRYSP